MPVLTAPSPVTGAASPPPQVLPYLLSWVPNSSRCSRPAKPVALTGTLQSRGTCLSSPGQAAPGTLSVSPQPCEADPTFCLIPGISSRPCPQLEGVALLGDQQVLGRGAGCREAVALGLLKWDQLPAGKFASGDEASAVALCHLEAESPTSPPKIQTELMHRRLQSSFPSKVVLATSSLRGTSHGDVLAGGTSLASTAMACVGFGIQDRASFVCLAPPCPAFPAGLWDDGSPATSSCSHAASAVTPAPRLSLGLSCHPLAQPTSSAVQGHTVPPGGV